MTLKPAWVKGRKEAENSKGEREREINRRGRQLGKH